MARLVAQVATAQYTYAPAAGLGYNLSVAADSSMLSGIPASAFNGSAGLPADNVQLCGNATGNPGAAACIPYLKGYGQITYAWQHGGFAAVGVDFEGKNNAYYQPPFAMVDLTARQGIGKNLELQFSVQNLFNSNTGSNLPAPNAGVPITGDSSFDGTTIQQTSSVPFLIPAAPQTFRLQLRAHVGG